MSATRVRKPSLALCAMVLASVLVLCAVAIVRGHDRFNEYTYYFYDNGDPGHPGVLNVVATMAFWSITLLATLLGATVRRLQWLLISLLFLVIGIDYLFRTHNHFEGGDVIARIVYWSGFAYVLRQVWRNGTTYTIRALFVAGLACFAVSDLFDLFTSEAYGRGAALEESAGCVGGWCLALATFGIAQVLLTARLPSNDAPGDREPS